MMRALLVSFVVFMIATFPATWLLMLFLGNIGANVFLLGNASPRDSGVGAPGRRVVTSGRHVVDHTGHLPPGPSSSNPACSVAGGCPTRVHEIRDPSGIRRHPTWFYG